MGRPKSKGERSEVDEMIDAAAPIAPDPEEDALEAGEIVGAEPAKEPEKPITHQESERLIQQEEEARKLAAGQEAEEEPAKAAAEDDEPAPKEPEASPSPDPEPTAEQLKAVNQGLLTEIQKLREKAGARKAQTLGPIPGVSPAHPPHVPPEGHLQPGVTLDDMIVFKDGVAGIDQDKFQAAVRQATAPSPEQAAAQENQRFRSDFLGSAATPEERVTHHDALARTEQAYEHLQLTLQDRADKYSISLRGASHDDVVGFMRQSGVLDEISQQYPDVAESLPDIIAASAMGSHSMMARAIKGYVARNAAPAPALTPEVPAQSTPPTVQPLPTARAPSLAPVGASPQDPGSSDKARYEALGERFDKHPLALPEKELAELERLEARFET